MSLRFGAAIPELVIPQIFAYTESIWIAESSGLIIMLLAVVSAVIFNMIDEYNEKQLRKYRRLVEMQSFNNLSVTVRDLYVKMINRSRFLRKRKRK